MLPLIWNTAQPQTARMIFQPGHCDHMVCLGDMQACWTAACAKTTSMQVLCGDQAGKETGWGKFTIGMDSTRVLCSRTSVWGGLCVSVFGHERNGEQLVRGGLHLTQASRHYVISILPARMTAESQSHGPLMMFKTK